MKTNDQLRTTALADIEHISVHGRTTGSLSPLTLFWTGSALELEVTGSELWVEVEADYDTYEPWISIILNAEPVSRQMVTAGRRWICVFRGMNERVCKNIRIVKDTQAMSEDTACFLQIHAIKTDGEFMPVKKKPHKIEFIGDSITSGEGAIGAKEEADWIPMWFSAIQNYTYMTAAALDADYRVISQSGWGVLTSWDNNPNCSIPAQYEKVCGLLKGATNEKLGANRDYAFDSWQPDIVVVNLGTNDGSAFQTPAWVDPATGVSYKQRLHDDGSYHEDDIAKFERAAADFLTKLRLHNKKAHLVWAYRMLGIPLMPAIYRAVDTYKRESGDHHVSIFQLPGMTDETVGARSHPGVLAHEKAAAELAGYLKGILQS
ncbi:SGNH/GDSL hydrolase family protein [Paenibacillus hexagrammi]|uniref:SGNH/GDSL hydrolase family protein n=1 Tax=Paenibacillus hexagrammi TaxID=2908839 RepID=A0ABY3SRG5_9BACL|nr:SGNH/GDSL hydrolase family protein [Paenibacillus sp. YPD9-1]UJF35751.1 SGNH/GDSL hydrolase family protein [Paenibacillus sp. YPD9-1]